MDISKELCIYCVGEFIEKCSSVGKRLVSSGIAIFLVFKNTKIYVSITVLSSAY